MTNKTKYLITLFLGACTLMYFALLDGFPIVTGDTGTYITSGLSLTPPVDRPIFYGLFIRFTSLGASVWLPVFAQCIILAYVLMEFIRKVIPGIRFTHIGAMILFVSCFTIGGWFASQLMPDIFVPILVLAVINYLFFEQSKSQKIILIAIMLLSVLTHNSNYAMLTLFCLSAFVLFLFNKSLSIYFRKVITVLGIVVVSWTALCTSNWMGGQGFTSSTSSHVFIMGKLVESGVLKVYLDKACPIRDYKICAFKDSLPTVAWGFHWDTKSPVQQTGGWAANKEEYNKIIGDIFSRPKYYPFLAYKSIEATARQLSMTQIDGNYILPWVIFDEETSPYKAVDQYFQHELNQLKNSKQNTKTFNIAFYDNLFFFMIIASSICMLLLLSFYKGDRRELYTVFGVFIALLVLNAFVTAILSSVNGRFNSRMIWILPFLNIVYLYKILQTTFCSLKLKLK